MAAAYPAQPMMMMGGGQPMMMMAPGGVPMMAAPMAAPMAVMAPAGTPAGLEMLASVNMLFVKQKFELLELCGWETQNKYDIIAGNNVMMYQALEESGCLARQCLNNQRCFEMKILNTQQQVVLQFKRPFKCFGTVPLSPCCQPELEVYDSSGAVMLGRIIQQCSCCGPIFHVKDEKDTLLCAIEGPCIMCCSPEFLVFDQSTGAPALSTADGGEKVIGKIKKAWGGIVREAFTDADTFGIEMSPGLHPKHKALLLGASILIDFIFFEMNKKSHTQHL